MRNRISHMGTGSALGHLRGAVPVEQRRKLGRRGVRAEVVAAPPQRTRDG